MTQLIRHICALAPFAIGPDAEWIDILPVGDFRLDDTRGVDLLHFDPADAAAVFAASLAGAKGGELLIDFDHRSLADQKYADTRAAGWIREFRVEGDRVLASVFWTPEGRAALDGRSYRFVSPVFKTWPDGRVALIEGAALVNDPALPQLRQLASKEKDNMDPIEQIAGLVGVDAGRPDDIVARVTALVASETRLASIQTAAGVTGEDADRQICARLTAEPDPAQFVPMAVFTDLQTQLASLQGDAQAGKVEAALEAARAAGKLVPAMESWATQLASKDLTAFEDWARLAPARVNLGAAVLAGKQPPEKPADSLSAEERIVASKLGLSTEQMLSTRNAEQKDA